MGQLFHRHRDRVFRLARGILGNDQDALDVVQEAFFKAFRALDGYQGQSAFTTWLHTIVKNLCTDHFRRTSRGPTVELDEQVRRADEDSVAEGQLVPRILGGNPARALQDREIRDRIDAALAELSEVHRTVLLLRELEGLSYEEISEVMGCAKGTVMSRLFHARRRMQLRLADLADPPSPSPAAAAAHDGRPRRARGDASKPGDPERAP
jgi:RNA polymerase sigma-70 factor (ECF subfamily)